jgi:DNA-binding NarL/FixJ family response regulator
VTIRVLIADDHQMFRDGVRRLLEDEPDFEVVAEVGDGAAAVEQARRVRPDIALIDLRMPGLGGAAAIRSLAGPDVEDPLPVIVVSMFDLPEDVVEVVAAGARGYLLKADPGADLVDAVRRVLAGGAVFSPPIARQLLDWLGATMRGMPPPARPESAALASIASLSTREREVLLQLTRGRSTLQIAGELELSEKTVKTHLTAVYKKLGVRGRLEAVALAYRAGVVSGTTRRQAVP